MVDTTTTVPPTPKRSGRNGMIDLHCHILPGIDDGAKDISEAEALERWAGFDYEVTYELWKKTENGENVTYERYTGNDIVIKVTDADGDKVSTSGAMIATYRFETDEIKEGTTVDDKQQEGLIIRDGQMAIATADLVSASQDNLTNYKIIATMKIKDNSASGGEESINADSELATEDFFVFTVTKLKTDLSE